MLIPLLALLSLMLLAYLLGSLPTGYLVGRVLGGFDIREKGSGSTGATNVLRNLGKGPALFVLLVDIGKGVAAIVLLHWIWLTFAEDLLGSALTLTPDWIAALGALCTLLGHSRPVWLGFQGGKSVATGLGILLAMAWPVGLGALATFGITIALSRIVSLSSITAAIAIMLLMVIFQQPLPYLLFGIAGGSYVIWRHRSNIDRLIAGTEPKVGQPLKTASLNADK